MKSPPFSPALPGGKASTTSKLSASARTASASMSPSLSPLFATTPAKSSAPPPLSATSPAASAPRRKSASRQASSISRPRSSATWTTASLSGPAAPHASTATPEKKLSAAFPISSSKPNSRFRSNIEKLLHTNGVWEGELIHHTRDGQRVVTASQWVLHRDSRNAPFRILEVSSDITALKRAELLQLRSQKLEALGTLAGGIAHDFNNILAAITGSASLAVNQIPKDNPVQACLLEIEKAGARGADLVRRILRFSRPADQHMDVQAFEPVVEEAIKLVRATIPAMIDIRSHFAPDLPKVRLDATQMYQVIVNLVTTAAHAIGDKPGLIELKLDARTISDQEIPLYSEIDSGHYVRLIVSDNGCGMDSATLQRIFDPFFSTKATGKGTGLGLSVVHGIVTSHKGVIRVYSEPGKGTTFQVYFPAIHAVPAP